jgi:hypothetical protein
MILYHWNIFETHHLLPSKYRVRDSFNWYGLLKVMDSIILTTNSDHPPAFDEDKELELILIKCWRMVRVCCQNYAVHDLEESVPIE